MGAGAATLGVSDPGSRVAVPVLIVLGWVVTGLLTRLQKDRGDAQYLASMMLLGVAARLFLFTVIHQTVGPYVFAPDQMTYESRGMGMLRFWMGEGRMPSRVEGTLQLAYPAMNAVIFLAFGFAKSAPAMLNVFMSAWTAIPVYYLTLLLVRQNRSVARLAAGLTVFFPSLILWSVLNVREAPTILAIVSSLYFAVALQRSPSFANLAGAVVSLSVLAVFREYMTVLVGAGAVVGMIIGRGRSPVRAFLYGLSLLMLLTFVGQAVGLGESLGGEASLEQIEATRQGFLYGAGSAYGADADVSTPAGALRFLPVGLTYFTLAPFPWAIRSTLQAMTLPETLMWYALLPLGLWGVWLVARHDFRTFTVPLAVLILVTFAYAMVQANVGTAYRHRAQILPIVFIFCAIGIRDWQAIREARRRQEATLARRSRQRQSARGAGGPRRL